MECSEKTHLKTTVRPGLGSCLNASCFLQWQVWGGGWDPLQWGAGGLVQFLELSHQCMEREEFGFCSVLAPTSAQRKGLCHRGSRWSFSAVAEGDGISRGAMEGYKMNI